MHNLINPLLESLVVLIEATSKTGEKYKGAGIALLKKTK